MSLFYSNPGATVIDAGQLPPPPVTDAYGDLVASKGPMATWRCDSASQLTDVVGVRHGTFTGTPTVVSSDIPSNSNGTSLAFAQDIFATVADHASFHLAAGSILIWFKPTAFPVEPNLFPVLAKDLSGVNNGDFAIVIDSDGFLSVQASATSIRLTTPEVIAAGSRCGLVVRFDSTGYDAYFKDDSITTYLGKNTNWTDGWTVNTQPILFATAAWAPFDFVGEIDEVSLFNRVLAQSETLELLQATGVAPTVQDFASSVPESATTAIDVKPFSVFTGTSANLVIAITQQPAGGDSAVNGGSGEIDYTAGAVSANTVRTVGATLTDASGLTSAPFTATVTVLDSTPPPPTGNANCFVESSSNTVVVTSMAALQSAYDVAPPGRQILLAAGTYSGSITFNRDGASGNPIVVRPQSGYGSVTITNASILFEQTSSWNVLSKMIFNSGFCNVSGDHNRVSRCRFTNIDHTAMVFGDGSGRGARDCRVDHCEFDTYTNNNVAHNFVTPRGGQFDNGNNARILMDHCYFHGMNVLSGQGAPGQEVMGSFTTVGGIDRPRGQTMTLDTCLMDNIIHNGSGESELISLKQGGWIIRFCTFTNTTLELTYRAGNNHELRSCWFEGGDQIRVHGDDHLIIGNRVVGNDNFSIMTGDATADQMIAGSVPIDSYARCARTRIIGNRMGSGFIVVGEGYSSGINTDQSVINTVLFGNTRDSGGNAYTLLSTTPDGFSPAQTGTTFPSSVTESWVPAVKLTASQVGPNAPPDPLC